MNQRDPVRREGRLAGVRLVGIFVPWQAVALTLGVVIAVTALAAVRWTGGAETQVRLTAAEEQTTTTTGPESTTTTTAPTTTTTGAEPVTTTTGVQQSPAKVAPTTTTTTAAPKVEATVGPVEYRADGPVQFGRPLLKSYVPVNVTVTNGPVQRIMVCVEGTVDNDDQSPFRGAVAFTDVNGTATEYWTYGYGNIDDITKEYYELRLKPEVKITLVHVVRHAWDPTDCPTPGPSTAPALAAPANVNVAKVGDWWEVTWDEVTGATGYLVRFGTTGPQLASCCSTRITRGGNDVWVSARRGHSNGPATTVQAPSL